MATRITGRYERVLAGVREILDDAPLLTVVENLRAVKGSEWREVPEPVRELLAGRRGEESAN